MEYFPAPLEKLVEQFARLPGVGSKSAQRLAFHVLNLPMEQAQAWVDHMDNADTSRPHGGRWTYAEATELGHKLGVPDDQMIAFFVALNMIWSDYGPVISAAGINTPDFYGKMARAFIDDKDAKPHKVARYMHAIAK